MTIRGHRLIVDSAQRVQRADTLIRSSERLLRETAKLVEHSWLIGSSARHVHADQRNREQEEREQSYQRRLAEAAALLRSLAREACLQAQEVRWRSAQTRAVSATLRKRRSSRWVRAGSA